VLVKLFGGFVTLLAVAASEEHRIDILSHKVQTVDGPILPTLDEHVTVALVAPASVAVSVFMLSLASKTVLSEVIHRIHIIHLRKPRHAVDVEKLTHVKVSSCHSFRLPWLFFWGLEWWPF